MEEAVGTDLEVQEQLAREFQPSLQGPLVGEKKSSLAITEEYAKADPVYVAKTAALPNTYSHYRPILGDGNCGWRAAGFAYFETLLRQGNKAQVEEELARMMSLNNLITTVGGFEAWLFEDMAEETTNTLTLMASSMEDSIEATADLLLGRFNDRAISDAIVYHFRLLASSWLKGSPENYRGFIHDGQSVDGYTKNVLIPPNQEIDHLGMTLLIDVLLKPIGFAVEIVYLDRSEGTQVNSHLIQAEDPNGVPTNPGGPMIHLLYRPSHYDILYKDVIQPPVQSRNLNIQVNRASFQQQTQRGNASNFSNMDMDAFIGIPGLSFVPSHHGFPSQYQPSIENQPYTTGPPLSTPLPTPISPIAHPSPPRKSSLPLAPPPLLTTPSFPSNPPTVLPHHPLPGQIIHSPTPASSFRPSKYEWEAAADWQEGPAPTFQTSTFKNSHYNTAHYNNPNFQPEEWCPEDEGGVGSVGSGGGGGGAGRKRSC